MRDPRALRRGETMPLAHPELGPVDEHRTAAASRFDSPRPEPGYESPPPRLGQHNEFVLGGLLGYAPERIEALRAAGAI